MELDPKYLDVYINKAICFRDQDLFENAYKELEKALKLKPKYYLAYFQLGLIYSKKESKDDLEKGIEFFNLAIKYKPNFSKSYFYRGLLEMKLILYGDAIQSFLKCKELRNNKDELCDKKIKECTVEVNKLLNKQYNNY